MTLAYYKSQIIKNTKKLLGIQDKINFYQDELQKHIDGVKEKRDLRYQQIKKDNLKKQHDKKNKNDLEHCNWYERSLEKGL